MRIQVSAQALRRDRKMKYPLKIVPHNCQPFNGKPCSSVSIEGIDSLFQHPMDKAEAEIIVEAVNKMLRKKQCASICEIGDEDPACDRFEPGNYGLCQKCSHYEACH